VGSLKAATQAFVHLRLETGRWDYPGGLFVWLFE